MRRLATLTLVYLTFSIPSGAVAEPGHHGHGHSPHHHAYRGLMRPDAPRISCCNENDCRPTEARFNAEAGDWEAIKDGRWITIPKHKIVDGDVPAELASEAHLCAPPPSWTGYGKDEVFCFIRPNGGA